MSERQYEWLRRLLLAVACFAAFHNSLRGVFIFDDTSAIIDNSAIRQLWPLNIPARAVNRPVLVLSFALNHAIGGLRPWSYHLVNVLIHLAAGFTLYGLIRRTLLLRRWADRFATDAAWLAFAAALLWLVHPLQTASVTYVVQRSESLMGLFYLLCLYCYLRGSQSDHGGPWFLASVACCWLGMGTKQVMVTAPLAILLYDRLFLSDSCKAIVRRRWVIFAGFAPALVWAAYDVVVPFAGRFAAAPDAVPSRQSGPSAGFGFREISTWEYARSQPGVILHYVRLAAWPSRLCLDYVWPVASRTFEILAAGTVIVLMVVASIAALKTRPGLGFLGVMFFLLLAPTSSILPIRDLAVEHRMYLPLACVLLLAVLAGYRCTRRLGLAFGWSPQRHMEACVLLLSVAALALTVRTVVRNRDYRSEPAMLASILKVAPHNARVHNRLGSIRLKSGEYDSAFQHLLTAKQLIESTSLGGLNRADVYNNLGAEYARRNDFNSAVDSFRAALQWEPESASARVNLIKVHLVLGLAAAAQHQYEEALDQFKQALELHPEHESARFNLALTLVNLGRTDQAADEFRKLLETMPAESTRAGEVRDWLDKNAPQKSD